MKNFGCFFLSLVVFVGQRINMKIQEKVNFFMGVNYLFLVKIDIKLLIWKWSDYCLLDVYEKKQFW